MKLSIDRVGVGGNMTKFMAEMTHDGNPPSKWELIEKTSRDENVDIFEQLNGYWASLPNATQDKIYEVYQQMRNVLDTSSNIVELMRALQDLTVQLLSYHPLDEVLFYLRWKCPNIRIPDSIKKEYKEDEQPGSKERTYIEEDYWPFLAMVVALRSMAPVWGEFINRAEAAEVGTQYKELRAFQLLVKSPITHSIPMEKLRLYVKMAVQSDKTVASAIYDGISSEDFPNWVLALVVLRRLTVGDVRGLDNGMNLISFIHKYIIHKVKGSDNGFIGQVKEKTIEGQTAEGENNLSKLEGYKIKQEIPAGDIAVLRFYVQHTHQLAQRIIPDIDLNLVDQSLASVRLLEREQIRRPQMALIQWVLSPVIRRGLLHLEKVSALDAMAVAQALLWFRRDKGFGPLAGLVSAIAQPKSEAFSLVGTAPRVRIPKDRIEELQRLYPFTRRTGGKPKPGKAPNTVAAINIELLDGKGITSDREGFSSFDWQLTLPQEWVVELTGNNNRRYFLPPDIRVRLADLAIAIAKRQF